MPAKCWSLRWRREVSYARAVALAHVAELLDELLPDREANDAIFRLTLSVLHALQGSEVWMPVTYFDLWLTRLVGFLPELTECIVCGRNLNGSRAYFHALADGLMCPEDKRLASSEISKESRELAALMFRAPVESFAGMPWPKAQGADLRKFLIQILQRHIEKKLVTAGDAGEGRVLASQTTPISALAIVPASSCHRTRACRGRACSSAPLRYCPRGAAPASGSRR